MIAKYGYDELPPLRRLPRLAPGDVLERVDEMLGDGRLSLERREVPEAPRRVSGRGVPDRGARLGDGSNLQAILD